MQKLFPSGVALGSAFCNREQERELLRNNINNLEHTVLIAPRRYGKTSLAAKVMEETELPHAWIELFSATSFESAEQKIAYAVGQLVYALSPSLKKLELNIRQFFTKLKPEIVLSAMGQQVVLHPLSSPTESITEILLQLDLYTQSLGKKAVIIFDEFQQIAALKDGFALEACIRHAVERSQAITYVFSGSNRHMLKDMFGQSSRPLYRLCKLLTLERIKTDSYEKFLQAAANNRWGKPLNAAAFAAIMQLTERHSFYVNVLCEQLWKLEQLPCEEDVKKCWADYTFNHKTVIVSDMLELSLNQKKSLNVLAANPTTEPYGKAVYGPANLSSSSLKQAVDVLFKEDLIYEDDTGLVKLLDPALAFLLTNS